MVRPLLGFEFFLLMTATILRVAAMLFLLV